MLPVVEPLLLRVDVTELVAVVVTDVVPDDVNVDVAVEVWDVLPVELRELAAVDEALEVAVLETLEVAVEETLVVTEDVPVVVCEVASQRNVPAMKRLIMAFRSAVVERHSSVAAVMFELSMIRNLPNAQPNTSATASNCPRSWRPLRINAVRAVPTEDAHGVDPKSDGISWPLKATGVSQPIVTFAGYSDGCSWAQVESIWFRMKLFSSQSSAPVLDATKTLLPDWRHSIFPKCSVVTVDVTVDVTVEVTDDDPVDEALEVAVDVAVVVMVVTSHSSSSASNRAIMWVRSFTKLSQMT